MKLINPVRPLHQNPQPNLPCHLRQPSRKVMAKNWGEFPLGGYPTERKNNGVPWVAAVPKRPLHHR